MSDDRMRPCWALWSTGLDTVESVLDLICSLELETRVKLDWTTGYSLFGRVFHEVQRSYPYLPSTNVNI